MSRTLAPTLDRALVLPFFQHLVALGYQVLEALVVAHICPLLPALIVPVDAELMIDDAHCQDAIIKIRTCQKRSNGTQQPN